MSFNSLDAFSLATSHSLEEAAMEPPSQGSKLIIKLVLAMVTIIVAWAAFFEIDIISSGSGKVVPISSIQKIQSLEAGIIESVSVQEGDIVKKNQILLRLNPAQAQGEVAEREANYEGLLASIARLKAESDGVPPVYPKELKESEEGAQAIKNEEELRKERQYSLEAQLSVLKQQMAQRNSEVIGNRDRLPQLRRTLRLLKGQMRSVKNLVDIGAAAPIEYIQLQKEDASIKSNIILTKQNMQSSGAKVREMKSRIEESKNNFRSQAREDFAKRSIQLRVLQGSLTAKEYTLSRTEIRSPVEGIIKTLSVNTIGGVAQAGRTLVEIVPLGDTLLVEARVSPQDIAHISKGQAAKVRISAFDSGLFSALDGVVERISPDSQADKNNGQLYFRVYVRTKVNSIESSQGRLPILPGMQADIDIITGHRTVLNYLLRPIARGLSRAMGEK